MTTGTDYTVKIENTFAPFNVSDENLMELDSYVDMDWSKFFGDVSPENMYKEAGIVAYGTVGKVAFYDSVIPHGLTLYDFTFEKIYKGDFKKGDKITVGADGSDVRMSTYVKQREDSGDSFDLTEKEIANTIIRYSFFGEEIPKESEKFLIFISMYHPDPNAKEGEDWPEGVYIQNKACAGRYYYNEKGEMERAVPPRFSMLYVPKDEKGNILPRTKDNKDRRTFAELDEKLTALQKAAKE